MNLHQFRNSFSLAVRGGGQCGAPKREFGQKLDPLQLRASLDRLHQRIRSSTNATPLGDLLDEYVATVAQLALSSAGVAAPFVPGGSVLAAALSGIATTEGNQSTSGG